MSVSNNIGYVINALLSDNEIKVVSELLELVHLNGMGERKPSTLSGGQRQRVALVMPARRPKLLLDEPLVALDKKLRSETQFELCKIQEQLSTTFVVVTHDQEEAMTLSTRIGVMNNGKLVQVGTPNEIYEQITSLYFVDFVGEISFIEVTVKEQKGLIEVDGAFDSCINRSKV